jgi:hypothetical protein
MEPRLNDDIDNDLDDLQETALLLGVSAREFTALMGRRSVGMNRPGFLGHADSTPLELDNFYFKELLNSDWTLFTVGDAMQYKAESSVGGMRHVMRSDFLLTLEPSFLAAAQDFAADEDVFLEEFAAAWTKVMNADRFDGPAGNLCEPYKTEAEIEKELSGCPMKDADSDTVLLVCMIVFAVLFAVSMLWNVIACFSGKRTGAARRVEMSNKEDTYDQGQQTSPRGNSRV